VGFIAGSARVIAAYMEIGSGNVSAVVGPYRQAIATATLKFGIPYFVVDVGDPAAAAGSARVAGEPRGYGLVSPAKTDEPINTTFGTWTRGAQGTDR